MKKLKIPRVVVITDKPKPELIERNTVWIQIKPNDNIKSLISTGMRMAPDIMVIDTVDTDTLNMAGSMNPDIDVYTYEDYYSRDHVLDSKYVDSVSDTMYVRSNLDWNSLSGSDQLAAERASEYMSEGMSIEDAVRRGCTDVSEGNSEPEYEEEDFYLEEPDYNEVLKYMKGNER